MDDDDDDDGCGKYGSFALHSIGVWGLNFVLQRGLCSMLSSFDEVTSFFLDKNWGYSLMLVCLLWLGTLGTPGSTIYIVH